AIIRTIAPTGHLHTFEFNRTRADSAREEFKANGIGDLVTVSHGDVCAATGAGGGFGVALDGRVDAVFLDLPEPWLALGHAKVALKSGRKLCSYSPCMEQVMKTCEVLRQEGYHEISTIELRIRNFTVTEAVLEKLDFTSGTPGGASPARDGEAGDPDLQAAGAGGGQGEDSSLSGDGGGIAGEEGAGGVGVGVEVEVDRRQLNGAVKGEGALTNGKLPGKKRSREGVAGGGEFGGGGGDSLVEVGVGSREEVAVAAVGGKVGKSVKLDKKETSRVGMEFEAESESGAGSPEEAGEGSEDRALSSSGSGSTQTTESGKWSLAGEGAAVAAGLGHVEPPGVKLCAQPVPVMRGHTAFLTFATTPLEYTPAEKSKGEEAAENIGGAGLGAEAGKID
ncbi:unnamed protein product, partial [Discosporangium mesarthrocarpum]